MIIKYDTVVSKYFWVPYSLLLWGAITIIVTLTLFFHNFYFYWSIKDTPFLTWVFRCLPWKDWSLGVCSWLGLLCTLSSTSRLCPRVVSYMLHTDWPHPYFEDNISVLERFMKPRIGTIENFLLQFHHFLPIQSPCWGKPTNVVAVLSHVRLGLPFMHSGTCSQNMISSLTRRWCSG